MPVNGPSHLNSTRELAVLINDKVQYYIMKYRSRDEISATILQSAAARDGITKTKIMYNSFLSYTQLLYYLEYLISNNLLECDANRVYNITSKGLEFLDDYNKMADLLKVQENIPNPVKSLSQ